MYFCGQSDFDDDEPEINIVPTMTLENMSHWRGEGHCTMIASGPYDPNMKVEDTTLQKQGSTNSGCY